MGTRKHSLGEPWHPTNTFGSRPSVALDLILRKQGLEETWERHLTFARAVWAAIDAWGEGAPIRCFVPNPSQRSPVVTLVKAAGVDVAQIKRWCLEEANTLIPGAGLSFLFPPGAGDFQQSFNGSDAFRIGHMGYSNPSMLLGTLATIDCALKAFNIPHGQNAVGAAAEVTASHWASRT